MGYSPTTVIRINYGAIEKILSWNIYICIYNWQYIYYNISKRSMNLLQFEDILVYFNTCCNNSCHVNLVIQVNMTVCNLKPKDFPETQIII